MQLSYNLHVFCNIIENLLQMTWQSLLQDVMSIMADTGKMELSLSNPLILDVIFVASSFKKKSLNIQALKT